MSKGLIIALVGPDGSGKTTQIRHLVDYLGEKGLRTRVVYGRVIPWLTRPLIWASKLTRHKAPALGSKPSQPRPPLRGWKARLFEHVLRVDLSMQAWRNLSISRRGVDVLVCDRYLQDSLITDFAGHLGWSSTRVAFEYQRLLNKGWPHPDLVVYLRTSVETSLARKDDIASPAEYQRIVELYHSTNFSGDSITVSTSQGIAETAKDIRSAVDRLLAVKA